MKQNSKSTKLKKLKTKAKPNFTSTAEMPISGVEWIHRDKLKANDYNPNHVAPPEMELLGTSILKSGWTQPIVIREHNEIVDGFHRYTISGYEQIYNLTNGYVPVVRLKNIDLAEQKMATIRHNRARGSHGVVAMANIIASINKLSVEELMELLGMSKEEVNRLKDRGDMLKRGSKADFNKAWVPTLEGTSEQSLKKHNIKK